MAPSIGRIDWKTIGIGAALGGAVAYVLWSRRQSDDAGAEYDYEVLPTPEQPAAPTPQVSGQLTPDTLASVTKLISQAKSELGYTVRVRPGSGSYRSCDDQHALYLIGRTAGDTRAVVTQVDGCRSGHTWGRAVDVDITAGGSGSSGKATDADYRKLGALGQRLGFDWGGAWTGFYDPGHFGWYPGMTIGKAISYFCPNTSDCAGSLAKSYAWAPSVA